MTRGSWQRSTMPFGQYKGWQIEDLPDSYLAWLTTIDLRGWLHDAVHREFDRRTQYDQRHTPTQPPPAPGIRLRPEEIPLARRLFEAGYRNLARVVHPDQGGDVREMQILNGLAQSLRDQIAALEMK